jgi:hypothetical protein
MMRELCFLHQQHQNSVVRACKDRASSRAKAMMQKCLVQKSQSFLCPRQWLR